jgi:hypothetical protein
MICPGGCLARQRKEGTGNSDGDDGGDDGPEDAGDTHTLSPSLHQKSDESANQADASSVPVFVQEKREKRGVQRV